MKSKMLKVFSLVLTAAVLITSLTFVAGASDEITVLEVSHESVTLDGLDDATVTINVIAKEALTCFNFEGKWALTEVGSEYFSLEAIESDVIGEFTGNNFIVIEDGKFVWAEDENGFPGEAYVAAGQPLLTATYSVAADTPEGEYTIVFTPEVFLALNDDDDLYDYDGGMFNSFVLEAVVTVAKAHVCGEKPEEMELVEGQPADCKNDVDGYQSYYQCSCGKYYEDAAAEAEILDLDGWKAADGIIEASHTEGDVVVENEVDATCTEDGSYEEVVYCTECEAEISRETVTVPATKHDWSEEASYRDNYDGTHTVIHVCENDKNHTEEGAAEEHTYGDDDKCICGAVKAHEHTPGEAVIENKVDATCTEDGIYEEVVYCTECEAEISRETVTVPATKHDWSEEASYRDNYDGTHTVIYVCENDKNHTEEGAAEEHTYGDDDMCICGAVKAHEHTPGEAVIENEVDATCTEDGSYDEVVYCTECEAEISRETFTVEALGHTDPNYTSLDEYEHEVAYECHEETYTESHEFVDGVCICGEKEPSEDPEAGMLGDVDLDGDVDAYDLTALARHVGGIEPLTDAAALKNADVDENGDIDAYDLTKHARYVGGIITDWKQE